MMKNLCFTLFIVFCAGALSAATWTVALFDSFGDGWNGGTLSLSVNGTVILNAVTMTTGYGPQNYSLNIKHGDQITTVYTPGSYASENEYRFMNEAGTMVVDNGAGTAIPSSITDPFMAAVLTPNSYQIGTGTATGYLPIYPYYGYTYTQSIYLRSELPTTLGCRRITKLKYYWNGLASATHSLSWKVYMGHTARTQFTSTADWVPLAELTEVFSGSVYLLATAGWVEVVLDKPFEYDGGSNLVVAVDENSELYDSSTCRFLETNMSANRSLVYYNDVVNPDPASPPAAWMVRAYIPNIVFQADPINYPPATDNFAPTTFPMGWAQYRTASISSNRWSISNSNQAGGSACELKAGYINQIGTSRLISPAIRTAGATDMYITFLHFFDDYGPGLTCKLQYSHDMNTWTDAGWSFASGVGDLTAWVGVSISGLTGDYTYLAWTMEGNHYQLDAWYLDDLIVNVNAYDATPIAINTEAVHNAAFNPQAVVKNNSPVAISFYVTFTISNSLYANSQWVSALAPYDTQTVDFMPYTPPLGLYQKIKVTCSMPGDNAPANDQLGGNFVCLNLDRPAYVDAYYLSTPSLTGPTTFNLKTPGTTSFLGSPSQAGLFMAGADWIGNRWFASEYDGGDLTTDNFWWINHQTGAETLIGESGASLHGIAWDPNHQILYGTDTDNLYTVNLATGAATLVGSHVNANWMIGIAYDNLYDVLYGVDINTNALFIINTSTGVATQVGPLGIDINYGQDIAFDRNMGYLFLAGYNAGMDGGPRLYWIDRFTGTALKVGNFPGSSQMIGFAIPSAVEIAELRIAADRTLSWDAIPGVSEYRVYGANLPNGTFTYLGSTPWTAWIEPGTPPARRFYKITAVYTRSTDVPENHYVTEYKDPHTGELLDPQPAAAALRQSAPPPANASQSSLGLAGK